MTSSSGLIPIIDRLDILTVGEGLDILLVFSWVGVGFPINIHIGLFSLDLMMSKARLAQLTVSNLSVLDDVSKNMTVPINVEFDNQDSHIAHVFSTVMNSFLAGEEMPLFQIELANMRFGHDRETSFDLFKYIIIAVYESSTSLPSNQRIDTIDHSPFRHNLHSIDVSTIQAGIQVIVKVHSLDID